MLMYVYVPVTGMHPSPATCEALNDRNIQATFTTVLRLLVCVIIDGIYNRQAIYVVDMYITVVCPRTYMYM